jgi:hypothetical protein
MKKLKRSDIIHVFDTLKEAREFAGDKYQSDDVKELVSWLEIDARDWRANKYKKLWTDHYSKLELKAFCLTDRVKRIKSDRACLSVVWGCFDGIDPRASKGVKILSCNKPILALYNISKCICGMYMDHLTHYIMAGGRDAKKAFDSYLLKPSMGGITDAERDAFYKELRNFGSVVEEIALFWQDKKSTEGDVKKSGMMARYDVLCDDTIIEIKCTAGKRNATVLQLMGYVALLKVKINYIMEVNYLKNEYYTFDIRDIPSTGIKRYMNWLGRDFTAPRRNTCRNL